MMSTTVFVWYFFYTVLAFGAAINTSKALLSAGVLFLWLGFLFYHVGCHFYSNFSGAIKPNLKLRKCISRGSLVVFSMLAFPAALYSAYFYTGLTPNVVLRGIADGVSNYNEYQRHFSEKEIGNFEFDKIPAILCFGYVKSILFYSILRVLFFRNDGWPGYVSVFFVIASYFLFSLARGTSFEIFEISIVIFFAIFLRTGKSLREIALGPSFLFLLVLGSGALVLYSYNISSRYGFSEVDLCINSDICYDEHEYLNLFSRELAILSAKLAGYFSFGILYISNLLANFWLVDFGNFFGILLPGSFEYRQLCDVLLECAVSWVPDWERYIYIFGIPGFLIFMFFLGVATVFFYGEVLKKDCSGLVVLFFIFFLIISLPVGSFIFDSSSNLIALFFFFGAFLFKRVRIRLQRKLHENIDTYN